MCLGISMFIAKNRKNSSVSWFGTVSPDHLFAAGCSYCKREALPRPHCSPAPTLLSPQAGEHLDLFVLKKVSLMSSASLALPLLSQIVNTSPRCLFPSPGRRRPASEGCAGEIEVEVEIEAEAEIEGEELSLIHI